MAKFQLSKKKKDAGGGPETGLLLGVALLLIHRQIHVTWLSEYDY
jgi:hypothetical protein